MGMDLNRGFAGPGRLLGPWVLLLSLWCLGCSGGGGGSDPSPSPTPPAVDAPTISVQPLSVTVTAGTSASFAVVAGGGAPLSYQWQRNGTDIGGAAAASYTLPSPAAGDSGALFSVRVFNSAGSVTSSAATLTVTAAALPVPYWVPVWSSANATPGSGSVTLGVVDPDAGGAPVAVDTLPALATNVMAAVVKHIRGGSLDPVTGELTEVATRHLAYIKGGRLFRLSLARGASVPAPVQLSSETSAENSALILHAVGDGGDDALLSYQASGPLRYVMLDDDASTPHRVAPTYPGDPVGALPLGWTTSPTTGRLQRLIWQSFMAAGGVRMFSTDTRFGDITEIARFGTSIDTLWLGVGTAGGRLRHGQFFIADGHLQRLDHGTLRTRVVMADVGRKIDGGLFDDTHLYLRVLSSSGAWLVRAADDNSSMGQIIASGPDVDLASGGFLQTRNHLIRISGALGEVAASLPKTGGTFTPLPAATAPLGAVFSWTTVLSFGGVAGDEGEGRVFYQVGIRTGSVRPDGSDRKEHGGLMLGTSLLPQRLLPHRLHTTELRQSARWTLLQDSSTLRWLDLASGDLGPVVGSAPAVATYGNSTLPYKDYGLGRAGSIGWQQGVRNSAGVVQPRLDALLLGEGAGSLRRLSMNIP